MAIMDASHDENRDSDVFKCDGCEAPLESEGETVYLVGVQPHETVRPEDDRKGRMARPKPPTFSGRSQELVCEGCREAIESALERRFQAKEAGR